MSTHLVDIDFEDFNTSTRNGPGVRKHDTVKAGKDIVGGYYVAGTLGLSAICPTVHDALVSYLGGRTLLAYREWL